MKRYAICVFALLCSLFPLAAQSIPVVQDYSAEGEELKSSMKNFANNANSMGTGRGYIGIYYSPVGTKDLMLTANFSLERIVFLVCGCRLPLACHLAF